jgi:hypothetical protein
MTDRRRVFGSPIEARRFEFRAMTDSSRSGREEEREMMNHRLSISLGSTAATLLVLGLASAQQPSSVAPPAPRQDVFYVSAEQGPGPEPFFEAPLGERIEVLGLEGMHPGKIVTGAPFSATATSETLQTLADGNHISRKTQTVLFRDSQGRFRKETTIQGFGPLASGQPKTFVIIHDPVAGTAFVLEPDQKIARQVHKLPGHLAADGAQKDKFLQKRLGSADGVQTEDLGKQTINGLSAQGTRHTRMIPVGQIGNEKPITIVSESWYSPDLQVVVMSKRSDPRFGDTTYSLSNIQQKEPDPTLFSVPADYTIHQSGPGHDMGGFGLRRRMGQAPQTPPTG